MDVADLAFHLRCDGRECNIVADVRGVGVFLENRGDAVDDVFVACEEGGVFGH
jgi:hypothetical protein